MSENEIVEMETLEEQTINEEKEMKEVLGGADEPKVSYIKSLSAIIVDEVIIGIISIILFYIFEALLRLGGYFISQKISMIFVLFVVVSILYISFMEASKAGKTLGKKLINL
jgi:uncharacterized RDD family membrane protein YckC